MNERAVSEGVESRLRDDLSNRLIHLTKGHTALDAARNFISIVNSEELRGGIGAIRGDYRCVCFTEAPVAKLAHTFAHPSGMPYAPFGVMMSKVSLFDLGGRPVIYQPDEDYDVLDESLRFRHKHYDPSRGTDFSWEREWRIRRDQLKLAPERVTLVVPTRAWADHLSEEHAGRMRGMSMVFDDAFLYIKKCPWHFIALEDLGIDVGFTLEPHDLKLKEEQQPNAVP